MAPPLCKTYETSKGDQKLKKQIQTISESEANLFLSAIARHGPTPASQRRAVRDTCLVLVMLDASLRVGEAVQLLKSDLWCGMAANTNLVVRAEIAKTRTERIIPITARLKKAIENLLRYVWAEDVESMDTPAFYVAHVPRPLSIRQVQKIVARASMFSIHRQIHPHVLRHTFATRVMKQSDSRVVQQLLGHASLTSTQIYTHPDQEDRKKAIAQMEHNTNAKKTGTNEDAPGDLEAST